MLNYVGKVLLLGKRLYLTFALDFATVFAKTEIATCSFSETIFFVKSEKV